MRKEGAKQSFAQECVPKYYFGTKGILKKAFTVLTLFFAVGFIAMNIEWAMSRLLWTVLRLPVPPASAWYMVETTNNSPYTLLINVSLINDKPFEIYSPLEKYNKEKQGRTYNKIKILAPEESYLFDLPSTKAPHVGIVFVSAISQINNPGTINVEQKVGIKLCTWRMADENNRIQVIFDAKDLVLLTNESLIGWKGWNFSEEL